MIQVSLCAILLAKKCGHEDISASVVEIHLHPKEGQVSGVRWSIKDTCEELIHTAASSPALALSAVTPVEINMKNIMKNMYNIITTTKSLVFLVPSMADRLTLGPMSSLWTGMRPSPMVTTAPFTHSIPQEEKRQRPYAVAPRLRYEAKGSSRPAPWV